MVSKHLEHIRVKIEFFRKFLEFFHFHCLSVWSIQSLGVNPNIQQWIYFFFPSCFPSFLLYFLIMISQITWNSNTSLSAKYPNLISLALTQFQDTTLLAQVVQHNGALERKHCCICNSLVIKKRKAVYYYKFVLLFYWLSDATCWILLQRSIK